MRNILLLSVIALRLITHDGVFLSHRKIPPKPQYKEVRMAIIRTWKRGSII